ncbi:MAG: hypothetical protein KY475_16065 [Planctomycetes bacterium]|nr:hypothetical protein [Planctomycetota bacterium]
MPLRLIATFVAAVCMAYAAAPASAAEVDSPLQPGAYLAPFDVKDCTGPAAGKTLCYYCRYGLRPVAAVFVREWTEEITELVAALEREAARPRNPRLATLVVYVGPDTQELEQRLTTIASVHEVIRTPLTIYRDTPGKLKETLGISPDAAVTAYTWRDGAICSARAFGHAALAARERKAVIADVQSLLE